MMVGFYFLAFTRFPKKLSCQESNSLISITSKTAISSTTTTPLGRRVFGIKRVLRCQSGLRPAERGKRNCPVRSRETDSTLPPCVSLLILHTHVGSGGWLFTCSCLFSSAFWDESIHQYRQAVRCLSDRTIAYRLYYCELMKIII